MGPRPTERVHGHRVQCSARQAGGPATLLLFSTPVILLFSPVIHAQNEIWSEYTPLNDFWKPLSFKYCLFNLIKSEVTGTIALFKTSGFALVFFWFYSMSNTQWCVEKRLRFCQIKNRNKSYSTEFWKYILTIHYSNTLKILKDALYNYTECRKQVFTKAIF